MKLEQNEKSMLFSETTIPDIFFTEYMAQMPGDYVKVYLHMFFLSKYNKDIKINDLSKLLSIPYKTIEDSIKYFEEYNLVLKKGKGYAMVDLQENALHQLYKPNLTLSPEKIEANSKNKSRAKVIDYISDTYFQGSMGPLWYNQIDLWFNKYSFDEQVMIALFEYCRSHNALHKNYVQTVAEAWGSQKIRTWSDLEKYDEAREKLTQIKKTIAKKLGKRNGLTEYEEAYIEKWVCEYNYGMDVIEIALKRTTYKTSPTFEYINNVISDWYDRNLKTAKDVQEFLEKRKIQNKNVKKLEKQVSKAEYEQRQYSNLEFLYENKQIDKKGEANG